MAARGSRTSAQPLALLAAAALLSSCAYATAKPRIVGGRDFPHDKAAQFHQGMPAQEVRQVLGEPLEAEATEGGGERWRYYERERQDEKIYILGFIPVRRPYWVVEVEVVVLVEAGVVRDVSFREQQLR